MLVWRLDLFGHPIEVPRAALVLSLVLVLNLAFVVSCFKELRISSFDPELATTLGINSNLMHYLLMTLVAMTTVAAFEAVGSIIVIAMLVVPAATAHLLTDRLGLMVLMSVVLAVLSAVLGHLGALLLPGWLGLDPKLIDSLSTSGMMAVAAGLIFGLVMLFAPRYGIVAKKFRTLKQRMR